MIGQSAPVDPVDRFVRTVAALETRIGDLERSAQRGGAQGFRNVVINGAMQVHQRVAAGVAVTGIVATGLHTADRWGAYVASPGAAVFSNSVEADAPATSGLRKSWKWLCTTANTAPAAATEINFRTQFEGQDLQRFMKGLSAAVPFQVSFWVKSNLVGTYTAELVDQTSSRFCSQRYTVNTSGVWEYKTLTFPADLTGQFADSNALSLSVQFQMVNGSNMTSGVYSGVWNTTQNTRVVGSNNLASAVNNYWQITGVQLEAGALATPFERRPYGTELALCQRYYNRLTAVGGDAVYAIGWAYSTTGFAGFYYPPATMRATPTIAGSAWEVTDFFSIFAGGTLSLNAVNSSPHLFLVEVTSLTGLTQFRPLAIRAVNAGDNIAFSAEL